MITDTSSRSYTMLPPVINIADITVFSQNVKLEVNLVTENNYGRWITPHSPEITNFSTTLSEFTANLAGLYQFYVKNSQDTEELAIQIQISVTGKIHQYSLKYSHDIIYSLLGSNFAELTSSNEYTLLSGNNIFYTDTTLVCVTSDTSVVPVWSYRETQTGSENPPTGVNWDVTTGISTLDIVTTQQGYYTCAISSDSYSIAIFNPDFTTSKYCS